MNGPNALLILHTENEYTTKRKSNYQDHNCAFNYKILLFIGLYYFSNTIAITV